MNEYFLMIFLFNEIDALKNIQTNFPGREQFSQYLEK